MHTACTFLLLSEPSSHKRTRRESWDLEFGQNVSIIRAYKIVEYRYVQLEHFEENQFYTHTHTHTHTMCSLYIYTPCSDTSRSVKLFQSLRFLTVIQEHSSGLHFFPEQCRIY